MNVRSLLCLLALGLLLPTLMLGVYWHEYVQSGNTEAHDRSTSPLSHVSSMELARAFAPQGRTTLTTPTDQPYDSRPCAQQPAPEHCNGVLPVIPHFSVSSRDSGNGYCFDRQPKIMEDQQITDSMGQTIADFQFWYFIGCKSYAAHLIGPYDQMPTLQLQVSQYDGSGIFNGITKLFWHLGDEDKLLPSATQTIGPLQDHEIWSLMLYSPDAPVQATATIHMPDNQDYAAFSNYYAAGQPTTINGQRS